MPFLVPRARAQDHDDEVRQALLARLLAAALGDEANTGAYHAAVSRYPATALLCAYEAARNLPAVLVKKSRGAYFTFLLHELRPHESAGSGSSETGNDAAVL